MNPYVPAAEQDALSNTAAIIVLMTFNPFNATVCTACGKCHSSATHIPTFGQGRRRLNRLIEMDLCSSTSQRRIAIKHGCDRKTVARNVIILAQEAHKKTALWLQQHGPFNSLQWDELITFEHSRLKPLSVAVESCTNTRCIIGFGNAA